VFEDDKGGCDVMPSAAVRAGRPCSAQDTDRSGSARPLAPDPPARQNNTPADAGNPTKPAKSIKILKRFIKASIFKFCIVLNWISEAIQVRLLRETLEQRRMGRNIAIPVAEMDRDLLAMYIRRMGHSVEKAVRYAKTADRGHGKPNLLRSAVDEWRRRGYPNRSFIGWAEENLRDHQAWERTGLPQLHPENELPPLGPRSPALQVLVNRASTRYWKPIPVPRDTVREIIRIGCFAPTSCNRQTWKLYVRQRVDFSSVADAFDVSNRMLVERAPVVIWIAIDERLYPEMWAAAEDAGIMGLQLELAATALGFGGCLMYGGDKAEQAGWRALVGAPSYHYLYLSFMFGYPAERTLTDKRAHPDDIAIFVDPPPAGRDQDRSRAG
jgi:nitroreductase